MVIHVVFVLLLARSDQPKISKRIVSRKEAHFAGGVAGGRKNQIRPAARAFNLHTESFVALLVQQPVGLARSHQVPVQPAGTLGDFVLHGVEQRVIVGGPGGAGHPLNALGQRFAGAQAFNLQRVLAKAGDVQRIGQQGIVVADVESIEAQKRMPGSQSI